eukprot:CAMPEP_0204035422 /NCGR_PEP_ID=MMETSP0360-20130528/76034_1 /ASSEMBLY_ACC=CAM_ASM_000342 /TAXON_ID=268821 /ORGANISM="Scrippsiella Hangoei, Strain SHTV-5" /LENGTH=213 /DNA_ID=CAMNT_0050980417 /DNA_START=12 /DNA_END=649 /DNA_ORIENTATION=+
MSTTNCGTPGRAPMDEAPLRALYACMRPSMGTDLPRHGELRRPRRWTSCRSFDGLIVVLALACLLAPAAAEECTCKKYRCKWEGSDNVYDVNHFKSEEAQQCIRNQTRLYSTNGDCLYECYDCKDDACACKGALACDSVMQAASVFCFIAASCACCMGAKTCWRGLFKAVIMDEEQAENYSVEKMDISARKGPVYVTCIFCGLSVALTIMGAG